MVAAGGFAAAPLVPEQEPGRRSLSETRRLSKVSRLDSNAVMEAGADIVFAYVVREEMQHCISRCRIPHILVV